MGIASGTELALTDAMNSPANAREIVDILNGTFPWGVTVTTGGLIVTAGGLTVTAGGATITAGGLTVTAGGATVTAGGLTVTAGGIALNGGNLTLADAIDIVTNATTGTKIGAASTQKLGFFGATPVVQPSAYTQTYSTADKTHANPTATALTHTAVGGSADGTLVDCTGTYSEAAVEENFKECATAINLIIADLADLKQLVNSVIDDLQALGLVG